MFLIGEAMSLWKRWFGKRSVESPQAPAPLLPTCPYCGAGVSMRPRRSAYVIWDCECGAVGSGSEIYPDLDEVADGLLAALGLGGSVSEPCVPIGDSGAISIQHYDIPRSMREFAEIVAGHGFAAFSGETTVADGRIYSVWARRSAIR